jgi:hypothetical protein
MTELPNPTMKTEQEIKNIKSVLEISLASLRSYDMIDDIKRIEGALIILDFVLGNKESEECKECLLKTTVNLPKSLESQK